MACCPLSRSVLVLAGRTAAQIIFVLYMYAVKDDGPALIHCNKRVADEGQSKI